MTSPDVRSALIGGVVGTLSAIGSGLFLYWVAQPSLQSGKLLYAELQYSDSNSWDEKVDKTYKQQFTFYNLTDDIEDIEVFIPVEKSIPDDLAIEFDNRFVIISQSSSLDQIKQTGSFTFKVKKMQRAGQIVLKFSSKSAATVFKDYGIASPNGEISIFNAEDAWQHF